jgi:predicted RNase H-like HicB family nuclease
METSRDENKAMNTYLVVIEGDGNSYSAYAPDLPGCVAAGDSQDEVRQLMHEAIPMHVKSLREHGEPVPLPHTRGEYVEAV